MTLLSVVEDVALKVGIAKPTEVMASTNRDMEEMQALVVEVVQDILEAHDWQLLKTIETITGDGAAEAFALPSDYERMLRKAGLWSSRWTWDLAHITDADEWLEYQVLPYTFVNGYWMIYGGEIHILPVMTATETAKYFYVSSAVVAPASGANKAAFTADDDTFRLSENLLALGLIWKWRAKKGQAYAEDMENYEQRKAYLIDTDQGSKPTLKGRAGTKRTAKWAFPQTVGA